jgi:Skp family chaperone for outer membrane proteins
MSNTLFNTPTGTAPPAPNPTIIYTQNPQTHEQRRLNLETKTKRLAKRITKGEDRLTRLTATDEEAISHPQKKTLPDSQTTREIEKRQVRIKEALQEYNRRVRHFERSVDAQYAEMKEQLVQRIGALIEGAEKDIKVVENNGEEV